MSERQRFNHHRVEIKVVVVVAQCEQVKALVVDEEEDLPPMLEPRVAVIDTEYIMERDSIHGGRHIQRKGKDQGMK